MWSDNSVGADCRVRLIPDWISCHQENSQGAMIE